MAQKRPDPFGPPDPRRTPRLRYNEKFIEKLQKFHGENPESDLSSLLSKYSTERLNQLRGFGDPVPPPPKPKPKDPPRPIPMPCGNLETLFPVAPQVQELIGLRRHTLGPHPPDFNTYFFRVLNEGQIIHQLFSTFVVKISASVVVKFGEYLDISEYQTMCYVWSHREGIPMTEPLGAVSIGDYKYFFMSYVEGDTLAKVWPGLSPDMKSSVRSQLEEILGCLRRVPLPSKYLGSGEPPLCRDAPRHVRVSENSITTEEEFKAFLLSDPRERNPVYMDLISSALETNHEIVMTHADLRPENIIVSYTAPDTIKINGLIDWGLSGAYPEWWEYVKALVAVNWDLSDWYSYLPLNAIGEHKEEWRFQRLVDRLVT